MSVDEYQRRYRDEAAGLTYRIDSIRPYEHHSISRLHLHVEGQNPLFSARYARSTLAPSSARVRWVFRSLRHVLYV